MNRRVSIVVGLMAVSASVAFAQNLQDRKPASPPDKPGLQDALQPPPGMSEADMMACIEAATPGAMHQHLAKSIGVWHGKSTMWMAPDTEPMHSECISTVTAIMDGRFFKVEIEGDMPGMGAFSGMGIYGFDNVSQKFQSTWLDNMSTGMMIGTGELSSDSKTLSWNFTYNCPITKKPHVMREIERMTGADTKTLEMHMTDPISGKEYKMMEIVFTRKPAVTPSRGSAR
ncbi:MAG TPA: DUF1579 domain-containing protein [Phycisphaerales bacterium]|nr:DUF1579 domain-containing protein [Phycisphaerales bacterium]HRQ75159.1 DUF1579 domain-containing protein [Phycisphaerales bacterium]